MKSRLAFLLIIAFIASGAIFVLHLLTRKETKGNGFMRRFEKLSSISSRILDLEYNSYYFAGSFATEIFLGNQTNPLLLLSVDSSMNHARQQLLQIPATLKTEGIRLTVQPPHVFLADFAAGRIYSTHLDTLFLKPIIQTNKPFIDAIPLPPSGAAVKIKADSLPGMTMAHLASTNHRTMRARFLEKQIDGIFCTDGMMLYNTERRQLIYTYYYRNQYIVSDSALKVITRAQTVDTTSLAKITVSEISSKQALTLGAPPLLVNRLSHTRGSHLFIVSALMADNENPDAFGRASVVDVYNLKNFTYRFSFYLPHHEGQRVRGLTVTSQFIFTLQGQHLLRYRIFDKLKE